MSNIYTKSNGGGKRLIEREKGGPIRRRRGEVNDPSFGEEKRVSFNLFFYYLKMKHIDENNETFRGRNTRHSCSKKKFIIAIFFLHYLKKNSHTFILLRRMTSCENQKKKVKLNESNAKMPSVIRTIRRSRTTEHFSTWLLDLNEKDASPF